jgi:hypothetical protein
MRRKIAALLLAPIAVLGLGAATSIETSPNLEVVATQALLTCTTRTSTPGSPNGWTFISSAGWWRLGPLQANPSCEGYVIYNSRGWRFDGTQCGQVWVRRPLPGGGTYIVPGSVKHICGGQSTVVVSRCGCQRFWVEAWPYAASDRHAAYWPVATTHW